MWRACALSSPSTHSTVIDSPKKSKIPKINPHKQWYNPLDSVRPEGLAGQAVGTVGAPAPRDVRWPPPLLATVVRRETDQQRTWPRPGTPHAGQPPAASRDLIWESRLALWSPPSTARHAARARASSPSPLVALRVLLPRRRPECSRWRGRRLERRLDEVADGGVGSRLGVAARLLTAAINSKSRRVPRRGRPDGAVMTREELERGEGDEGGGVALDSESELARAGQRVGREGAI